MFRLMFKLTQEQQARTHVEDRLEDALVSDCYCCSVELSLISFISTGCGVRTALLERPRASSRPSSALLTVWSTRTITSSNNSKPETSTTHLPREEEAATMAVLQDRVIGELH